VSITDEETKQTMKQVYDELHYTLDPHGAVGYLAFERYLQQHSTEKGLFLETAHPVKFYDVVEPVLKQTIPLPDAVKEIIDLPKKSTLMNVSFEELKDFLLKAV
jgi:threonine synthase